MPFTTGGQTKRGASPPSDSYMDRFGPRSALAMAPALDARAALMEFVEAGFIASPRGVSARKHVRSKRPFVGLGRDGFAFAQAIREADTLISPRRALPDGTTQRQQACSPPKSFLPR